jgi:ABC-type branched-subunit amino acid transport system substrate-binding protein
MAVLATVLGLCGPALVQAQIRIGQTSGFTGPVAASVNEINVGAKLYIDSINAEGGINGQQIELVSLDDKFQVPLAVENAKKLIADPKVVSLFLNRGTPHAQALMPLLAEGRITLIAPSTGAMIMHSPVNPWIFNVRATYQIEAERVTRHLALAGLDRVAVVYVNDTFGEDAAQGALKVFKEAGKTPTILQAIDRAKPDYNEVVAKIAASKPLGILIIGSSTSVASGIAAIRASGSQAAIATLSNNAATGFVKSLGANQAGIIVSQVFPSERRLAAPLIAEAVRLANLKKIPQITPAMIEGFAAAKVLVLGLKRAAKDNKEVTRSSLKKALESFNRVDIGGLEVSFSTTDHTGLDFADLSIIDADGAFRR